MLTKQDLKAIDELLDNKLDEKFVGHLTLLEKRLDKKMDKRFDEADEKLDEKLVPINDFVEFAEPAIKALLEESQQNFELKIPQRVAKLEELHPIGVHTHVN